MAKVRIKRLPAILFTVALVAVFVTSSTAIADDLDPPIMEAIFEAEGQYYKTTPSFSNFGFDDLVDLDDGWYQMDSFSGNWTALFTNVSGNSWDNDGWSIPAFALLSQGSHTIYFKATDDTANVEGESGEWSWQFFKDTTPPGLPAAVTSTSHFTSVWSTDPTIDITWTDATDNGSGLDGYSILWNTSPATTPDQIKDVEEGVEGTTSAPLADGYVHYFHIRSVDNLGNWQSAVHLGPFFIDTNKPTMKTIIEPEGQYYKTAPSFSTFGFDDNLALDDGWYQMDSFVGAWTALFTNTTGDTWNDNGWVIPNFAALSQGSHTIYFKTTDDTGNVEGEAGEWSWQFIKDTTPPTDPTAVTSPSHTTSAWSTDPTINVTWTDATDSGSGLDGYSILWDISPTTTPDQVKDIEQGVQSTTSPSMSDGSSIYFHIRGVDNAGNWQSAVHLGPFYVDTTPPAAPTSISSPSHTISVWSGDTTVDVIWNDSIDSGSGLDGYSVLWNTSPTTTPDQTKDIEEGVQISTSPVLSDGNSHYFHIRSVDNIGNWRSATHYGPFYIDTSLPTMESITESEGQYHRTSPSFSNFGFDDNMALDDGWYQMDSFAGTWTGIFTNATGTAWDSNGWSIPVFDALADGSHTIYFKASDDIGNVDGESGEWNWQFFKDATPPTMPTAVSGTDHSVGVWSRDNTIEVTWTDATDNGSGLDGYSILWNNNPTAVPDETKEIEGGVQSTTSPALADGNNWYFHIRSVDNIGNWQTPLHLGPFFIDITPPTMETISEIQGQYYNTAPVLSDFSFTDNVALDNGKYKVDSISGTWTTFFSTCNGTFWENTDWALPSFSSLSEGSHTIYFKAADDIGNIEGEAGEWNWQFFKDTVPPEAPTDIASPSHKTGVWSKYNTVDITWKDATDATSGLDGYSYKWDTISNSTPDTNKDIEEGVEQVTSPPLADGYQHYFHIRSVDNAGNWRDAVHYGPFSIDTTAASKITDLAIANIGRNTAILTWTAPGEDADIGKAAHYDIRYSTVLITNATWDAATRATGEYHPSTANSSEVFVISKLTYNTTYYFAIKTIDKIFNFSELSNVVNGTTSNGLPSLSGAVTPESGYNSTAFTYTVTYTDIDNDAPSSITVTIDNGTPENMAPVPYQDNDFTNGEMYECSITGTHLELGNHTFYFAASDGLDAVTTNATLQTGPYILSSIIHAFGPEIDEGVFSRNVTMNSQEGNLQLDIEKGTLGRETSGEVIRSMSIKETDTPPVPPSDSEFIGSAYDLGPDGATFEPAISVTFQYDDSLIPEGVSEDKLVIVTWDEAEGKWVELNSTVDTESNIITTATGHFSYYAILVYTRPASFTATDLSISPQKVESDEDVTVSAVITNTGDIAGEHQVNLEIDGTITHTKKLTLAGGESAEVSFVTSLDASGTYSIKVNDLADTLIVRSLIPASFSVNGLDISPGDPALNENINISVLVTNIGDLTGTHTVSLEIDEVITQTEKVNLAAGESKTVTFKAVIDTPGTHSIKVNGQSTSLTVRDTVPAAFITSDLTIEPDEIISGDNVTISALITNTGGRTGEHEVLCEIDGMVIGSQTVSLNAGEGKTVTFVTSMDATGNYTVKIGDAADIFIVATELSASPDDQQKQNLIIPFAIIMVVLVIALLVLLKVRKEGTAWFAKFSPSRLKERELPFPRVTNRILDLMIMLSGLAGKGLMIIIPQGKRLLATMLRRGNSTPDKATRSKKVSKANRRKAVEYNSMGLACQEKEDYAQAIVEYDKAIELHSDYAEAYGNRGVAYHEKADYERALIDYNRALELNPDYIETYGNRGVIFKAQGEMDKAIADFEKVISLTDNEEWVEIARQQIAECSE